MDQSTKTNERTNYTNGLKDKWNQGGVNLNGEQKRRRVVDLSVVEPIVGAQLAAESDPLPVLQWTRGALCL